MTPSPAPSPAGIPRGKLAPPLLAFEPVLPRAAEVLLRTAMVSRLVTVSAPPGYGKTVLLGRMHEMLTQRGQRCVWVTLDDRDCSLEALHFLLGAAVGQAGLQQEGGTIRDGREPRDAGAGLERLLLRLDRLEGQTTVFLDNLGFCTDPELPAVLDRLVFGGFAQVRLVLSSSGEIPLELTRAKLELGAVELHSGHLAFDLDCTGRFLANAGVTVPDADMLRRVHERTEGWPAALRLLQIVLSGRAPGEDVLDRFTGEDRDIAAVLTRRVLAGFKPAMVEFLVEIAPLREFSGELAAHATGHAQAGEWLELLLARNVLVFPIDPGRRWLRMHTLLRQYLLAEGARRQPRERRREILERAAQWHAARGDHMAALEAALDAPAPVLAAGLLERLARPVAADQGRLELYVRWADQLLACGVTLSLEAHTWYVWSLCFTLQYERAHRAIDALNHRLAELDPRGEMEHLHVRLGLLRVVIAVYLDMPETTREEARRWLVHQARRNPLAVATVHAAAAIAELCAGDSRSARRHMHEASSAISRSTSSYGHAWVALISACVELTDGEPLLADRLLTQARTLAVGALGEDAHVVGTMDFVHARALLEMGREAAARDKARLGLEHARRHGVVVTALLGLGACVRLWDGASDSPFAPEALDAIARSYPPRVQRTLAVMQVDRLLVLGRAQQARSLAQRNWLDLDPAQILSSAAPGRWCERILALRLQVEHGEGRQAQAHVERLLREATAAQCWPAVVNLQLIALALHVRADRRRAAIRSLTLAILAAARRRLVQPLYEQLPLVASLLACTPDREFGFTQGEELALLQDLRTVCDRRESERAESPPAEESPRGVAPVDELTAREMQLLELLAQGLSNQQIADRTSLSIPTVKWHFYNLYNKLQVKNRAAAVARARALQMLH